MATTVDVVCFLSGLNAFEIAEIALQGTLETSVELAPGHVNNMLILLS